MFKFFIFTDIHGFYDVMIKSLKENGFDEKNDNHILVCLGDLFDRGKQNKEIFDYLNKLYKKKRFLGIRGNHDDMLLSFLKNFNKGETIDFFNFSRNGLNTTLESLASKKIKVYDMMDETFKAKLRGEIVQKNDGIVEFLENLSDEIILKTKESAFYLTHSGYYNTLNKNQFLINLKHNLLHPNRFDDNNFGANKWMPFNWSNKDDINSFLKKYIRNTKENIYVFGHWHAETLNLLFNPNDIEKEDMHIFKLGNIIGLDTMTVLTQKMNVMIVESDNKAIVSEPNGPIK